MRCSSQRSPTNCCPVGTASTGSAPSTALSTASLSRPTPGPTGRSKRMNRTLKEAPVQRYHYQTTAEVNTHLQSFLLAYKHAKRFQTFAGSPRTNLSARSGKRTRLSLPKTRPTSPWDYTPRSESRVPHRSIRWNILLFMIRTTSGG
jgi:hypothetical protein